MIQIYIITVGVELRINIQVKALFHLSLLGECFTLLKMWLRTWDFILLDKCLAQFTDTLRSQSVHFSHSVVFNSLQPHGLQHARLSCPSPTPVACSNSLSLELVMSSNHLILCHPLLLLPSIFPASGSFPRSQFVAIRCPKYWSFSFSISPSSEYSGPISFRMDWFDLLAV